MACSAGVGRIGDRNLERDAGDVPLRRAFATSVSTSRVRSVTLRREAMVVREKSAESRAALDGIETSRWRRTRRRSVGCPNGRDARLPRHSHRSAPAPTSAGSASKSSAANLRSHSPSPSNTSHPGGSGCPALKATAPATTCISDGGPEVLLVRRFRFGPMVR